MKFHARVWKFGDNINTDLILPITAFYLSVEEQAKHVFGANRPGWVDLVRPGDILLAGKNFGMGSSRPAARLLKTLGLSCLLAHSINGLFFRNSINWAFPAIECPDVDKAFEEGQTAEVDFDNATVTNIDTGTVLQAHLVPEQLLDIIRGGGVYELLERDGYLKPKSNQPLHEIPVTVTGK